jgi:chromate transport protein ChrA
MPLFGGIFSAKALVIYASWIGIALAIKYLINKFKNDIKLKWYEILPLTLYAIFCMFLWFPLPFNILFSILVVIGNIIGYRAQIKSIVKEK